MQFKNFINAPREASNSQSSGQKRMYSFYKEGVKVVYPKGGKSLKIQILPAYHPDYVADPQSYVPCMVDGNPTAWFGMIQGAKFVGHSEDGNFRNTANILSLNSFEGGEPCPYQRLHSYCRGNPDWKYLTERTGNYGQSGYRDAIIKNLQTILLMNVVDVENPGSGVLLGEFKFSVANTLLNKESGIVFQRNMQLENFPNVEEALKKDPMLAYANGDITNPNKAPVFVIELQGAKSGQPAGYSTRIEFTNNGVTRRSAADSEMAGRHHLENPESFLNIPTGQEIVDTLVQILKGHTNGRGIDEVCAIKEAVGDLYRVDVNPAPGAVSTVQGWNPPPAPTTPEPEPVQQTTQSIPSGFAPNPARRSYPPVGQATAPQPTQTVMAIPGEAGPGSEPSLAADMAARLRQRMNAGH